MTAAAGHRAFHGDALLAVGAVTADALIMKGALGVNFVRINILRVLLVALALVTGDALPQLRDAARALRVVASGAGGVRLDLRLVDEIRVGVDQPLVPPVTEVDDAAAAFGGEFEKGVRLLSDHPQGGGRHQPGQE